MLINPINQSYFLSEFRDKKVMLINYWFSVFKHNLKIVMVVFVIEKNPKLIQLHPVIDIMDNAPKKLLINGNF
ncbi:MAG: hypothetical protein RLZZ86_1656 [Cyanobacteriota bacterium]